MSRPDLTAALRALTDDQPPQPPDRLGAVATRANRLRRRRAAGACAAVLVVAAPVALVVDRHGAPPPVADSPADSATPLTSWPDRSLPEDQRVAEGALRAALRDPADTQPRTPGSEVSWLFRGNLERRSGGSTYVAVFLLGTGETRVLVTAHAERDQMDDDGTEVGDSHTAPYSWTIHRRPVTPGQAPAHVGLYVPEGDPLAGTTLFVLSDPVTRRLTYRTTPLPYAEQALDPAFSYAPSGSATSGDGVFQVRVGGLAGPVRVVLSSGAGEPQPERGLTESDDPPVVHPLPPDLPAGFRLQLGSSGQASRGSDGRWEADRHRDETADAGERLTAYVRCYGGGTLGVTLAGRAGRAACDGQTHVLPSTTLLRPGVDLVLAPDRRQAFHIAVSGV